MEVRQQRIDHRESMAGQDEQIGPTVGLTSRRPGLERPNRRRADCNNSAAGCARALDLLSQVERNRVPLAVDAVRTRVSLSDGTERVESDVKGQSGERDAAFAYASDQLRR